MLQITDPSSIFQRVNNDFQIILKNFEAQLEVESVDNRKTYTLRRGNNSSFVSTSEAEDVPSNNTGKSDDNSSKRVIRTAFSCSCA